MRLKPEQVGMLASLRDVWINHDQTQSILDEIFNFYETNLRSKTVSLMKLSGPTGSGKSTLISRMTASMDNPKEVLYVTVPEECTKKNLVLNILTALGDPKAGNGPCLTGLSEIIGEAARRNGLGVEQFRIEPDPEDSQALYLRYPTATPEDAYVGKAVKIESGAKSALDPNSERAIRPYLESDIPDIDLSIGNVTTVDAERTLWDKVVILHGLRRWFDNYGELKGNGQRVSRHYYDLHQLLASETGQRALKDRELGADCVTHARMFFNRPAFDLATATPPTFSLRPKDKMLNDLRRDYRAMSGMIFGEAPAFEEIIDDIIELETALNAPTEGAEESDGQEHG